MAIEQRDRLRFRRRRDELLERVYDAAKKERRRLAEQLSGDFREAVDTLEDFDAYDEERRGRRA